MGELVKLDKADDGVGTIAIDRPKVNALSHRLAAEIADAVEQAAGDESIRSLVVWGGPRVFAAGADIKEMTGHDPVSMFGYISEFAAVFDRLQALEMVTIAAINGYALGGGCELALACDFRIACRGSSAWRAPRISCTPDDWCLPTRPSLWAWWTRSSYRPRSCSERGLSRRSTRAGPPSR